MNRHNFAIRIVTDKTPDEVFAAINDVGAWWSGEITGNSRQLGDEFTYRYKDMHMSRQKISEFVPGRKVVWHVTEANLTFTADAHEWVGTDIVFVIVPGNGETELHFTHVGLTPQCECYDACSNGWSTLVNDNLRNYIATGNAQTDAFEKAAA